MAATSASVLSVYVTTHCKLDARPSLYLCCARYRGRIHVWTGRFSEFSESKFYTHFRDFCALFVIERNARTPRSLKILHSQAVSEYINLASQTLPRTVRDFTREFYSHAARHFLWRTKGNSYLLWLSWTSRSAPLTSKHHVKLVLRKKKRRWKRGVGYRPTGYRPVGFLVVS